MLLTASLRARLAGALFAFLTLLPTLATAQAAEFVFTPAPQALEPTQRQLLDITRAGDRIIAVGAAGLVITSDDNGQSWQQADIPVSATLTAVTFPTPEKGWAVGHAGVILHTRDAGSTWELQFDGRRANDAFLGYAAAQRAALEAELQALDEAGDDAPAADRDELEYLLEEAIFLEEDAQLAVETGPVDPFLAVDFVDERRGLAAGAYGMLYRTEDGGESWQINLEGIDNPYRYHYYGIHMNADGEVYLAGEAGLLYRSADGGLSFEQYFDIYEGSLFGVLPLNGGVLSFGLRGNLFLFDKGSDSWETLATANETSLYGGAVLADGDMLLLGSGGRLLRLDGRGAEQLYQHPSRSTFAAALDIGNGDILLVGMDGLASFEEAQAQ